MSCSLVSLGKRVRCNATYGAGDGTVYGTKINLMPKAPERQKELCICRRPLMLAHFFFFPLELISRAIKTPVTTYYARPVSPISSSEGSE